MAIYFMQHVLGVPFRCPRMGGWDKGNTPWRRILRSKIRNSAVVEKRAYLSADGDEANLTQNAEIVNWRCVFEKIFTPW